ncbi:MAG: hypothetical protein RL410_543 [Actinomycetota bacterium]|jgi:hypothetical protein
MVDRTRVPAHLHDRYGIKPANRPLTVIAALTAMALSAYLFTSINARVSDAPTSRLLSWQVITPLTVEVKFTVSGNVDSPLVCVIRAQDEDRFDVGYALARVDHPQADATFDVVLATREEAFAVPAPVCEASDSPGLLGSHFRPGLLPPAQDHGLFIPGEQITSSLD